MLKHRDDPIVWDLSKTKYGKSLERLQKVQKAKTTKEYAQLHPGPGGKTRADFEDEFKRGFFTLPTYGNLRLLSTYETYVEGENNDADYAKNDADYAEKPYGSNTTAPNPEVSHAPIDFNRCRGDWPLYLHDDKQPRDPVIEQKLQSWLDHYHGETLGLTQEEYADIRRGRERATSLYDSHFTEVLLQIVDPTNEEIPMVDAKDIRLDQFKLADLRDVSQDQIKPMLEAIAKEVEGLCQNGVFQFVPELPDKKPLNSRIVLKVKYRADGSYDKHKGRLVVKGFQAVPGVDFFSTFSPMGTLTTVRAILAIAVAMDLDVWHVDIPQAFVQSKIDTPIYLQLPNGITVDARYADGRYDNRVVKLLRALYGLKQSPQLWNKELNRILTEVHGFTRCHTDSCLYYHSDNDGKFVLLVAEVDDLVITGSNEGKINSIKKDFTERYKITAWETISSFLGINIHYDRRAGTLTMDVKAKVDELFDVRYKILNDCQGRSTPLSDQKHKVSESENKVDLFLKINYANIVGALIYMSITCRPDLTLAVGKVSRGMHNPTPENVLQLRQIVGYLKVHRDVKLTYRRSKARIQRLFKQIADVDSALLSIVGHDYSEIRDPIVGMSDADFASGTEPARKSISGMAFFLYGNLICWRSKLQPLTAKSTHAAELIALSFASDEGVWLRRLLLEIGFVIPHLGRVVTSDESDQGEFHNLQKIGKQLTPPILCDNKGTVFTANNPSTDINTKALETRWYDIRDKVRDGLLKVFHIGTNYNVADFFTKPLQGEKFESFRNYLMGDYIRKDIIAQSLLFLHATARPACNPACKRRP